MSLEGFKNYLQQIKVEDEVIKQSLQVITEFNDSLHENRKSIETVTINDLHNFVNYLVENKKNSLDNFIALMWYSSFIKNNDILVALYEYEDGYEVFDNLATKLAEIKGEENKTEVFKEITLPPLGTHASKKPPITKKVIEQLEAKIDTETCKKVLSSGLHSVPKERYQAARQKYLEIADIDKFLEYRHTQFVKQLEQHKKEGTLFFTQEITDDVLDYVRTNPEIKGVRDGDIVYEAKIPYMAHKYVNEKDEIRKKYHYCHCFWVRESLVDSEIKVSPMFCYCSAGFHKQYWDAVFDEDVKVEVVNSILKGDNFCRFAVHLPKEGINLEE
ncbi:MAG: hypothetical protein ACFFCQ_12700 [Promethearchaeota archaeon]